MQNFNGHLINEIGSFICFNQKNTIKYEYLVSEKHKQLKEFFIQNKNNENEIKNLKEKYIDFIIFTYEKMLDIFNNNQNHINKIFTILGKTEPPRTTIKTIDKENVLSIYRSTGQPTFSYSPINKNTGFTEIIENNKKYFLNNNLPESFKNGEYKNPRLDDSKLKDFKQGRIEWKDCWFPYSNQDNEQIEYYSSTLIIPMSIVKEEGDEEEFLNHFFEAVVQSKDSRTIWGFLCFDHQEVNYFNINENLLVKIGYILADILSLYLMYFYNHVTGSKTVNEIEKKLLEYHML